MDGTITIGAKIATDEFDKQIANMEKKIDKAEDKKILIEAKMANLDEEFRKHDELIAKVKEYERQLEELNKAKQSYFEDHREISSTGDTEEYAKIKQDIMDVGTLLAQANKEAEKHESAIMRGETQYTKLENDLKTINGEIADYKTKIEGIKLQKHQSEIDKIRDGFKSVGSNVQNATQKVARLAIGIFGIRSAYLAVRRASNDLASYDQQYATNLEYIRFVLTQAIAPVLQWIVRLAGTLLSYLNAILSTWFGISLFGNSTAEKFASMKKNAGGVAKSAKEIRKQLAGFDEMNVLGDNTASSGGGGGAGDVPMPDLNLNQPLPKWMEDLLKYKDLIISAILGIAGAIWAIHAGATALQAIGVGLLIGGIVYAIEGIIGYINDPSWENFGQIIEGIGVAVVGLGLVIGSLPVAIGGAIALIVGLVVQNWEAIKTFLENGLNWLKDKIDWVGENFGIVGKFIYETFIDLLEGILKIFDNVFVSIKGIFDGIITFIKSVFTGNWKQAWEGIKQIFTNIWNILFGTFKTITDTITSIVLNFWTMLKTGASQAWEGIRLIFSSVASFFRNTFETAWTAVKNVFSTGGRIFDGIKDGIVTAFKAIVNALISGINRVVAIPFNTINSVLNKIRNIDILGQKPFTWIGTISVPQIPYLRTGGIVSMPNKGVPVGAMAGESGREGVIPLTDTQAMEELGRAIGRYINLNATIPVYVGNRQIAREIKRIDAEDDFAYNR